MPIKNFNSGEIPYLISYQPYELAVNEIEPRSISDMVSIDILPSNTPVIIDYKVGAVDTYKVTMNIKNLTNNTVLDILVALPPNLFTSTEAISLPSAAGGVTRKIIEKLINPLQTIQINFELDKKYLDLQAQGMFDISLPVTVRNRSNTSIIIKTVNVVTLPQNTLPANITIE